MNWFLQIDMEILTFCEKLSHKQQRFTGKTHFFWMKIIASLLGVSFIYVFFELGMRWDGIIPPLALFVFSTWGFDFLERKAFRRLEQGLANPLKIDIKWIGFRWINAYIQISFLTSVLLVLVIMYPESVGIMAVALSIFFGIALLIVLPACDPLPPTKGYAKEWLKSFFSKPAVST